MGALLFPDNTVLVNFALLGRSDLLERLVNGRAAWTATVSAECERSSRLQGLNELKRMPSIFGDPLFLETAKEIVDTATIRNLMAAPTEPETAHLGEAEAVAIITSRGLQAAFVSDDRQARVVAGSHGIPTYSTCNLLKLAVRVGLMSAEEAWASVTFLRRKQRRLDESPSGEHAYMDWLTRRSA